MFSTKITTLLLASFAFAFSAGTSYALSSEMPVSAPHTFHSDLVESLPLDIEAMIPEGTREHGTFNVSRVQTAQETVITLPRSAEKVWTCNAPQGLLSDETGTVRVCSFVSAK